LERTPFDHLEQGTLSTDRELEEIHGFSDGHPGGQQRPSKVP
jgi:hypothetical protein